MGTTSHEQLYNAFGAYVRSQRLLAQLTLRQAAELARISNPYLSQIEHGLALPSIGVLSSLADALSVSAETMLLRAAGIARPDAAECLPPTEESIRQDPRLDDSQKHALLAVLSSFVGSGPGSVLSAAGDPEQPVASAELEQIVAADEPAQLAARRNAPTRRPARPAAADRGSSHRQQGV